MKSPHWTYKQLPEENMRIWFFWVLLLIMYKNNPQVIILLICERFINDKGGITQWYIHSFQIQIEMNVLKRHTNINQQTITTT